MSPNNSTACLAALLERKTMPGDNVSTGPPKYTASERFFSAFSSVKISLSTTWVGLLTIRPTTIPSFATTEDGNISTTDSLKKGSLSSGRATRKSVFFPLSPLLGLSCAACTGVLLRTRKRQMAIAVLVLSQNILCSSPSRECYASSVLDTTNLPP